MDRHHRRRRSLRPWLAALTGTAMLVVAGCSSGAAGAAPGGSPSSAAASPLATTSSASPSPSVRPSSTKPKASPSPTRPKATASPTKTTAHATGSATVKGARYAFPVQCSSPISYGHSHHDYPATDIFAAVGCLVVSPVDGVVDEVSTVDRWNPSTNLGATRGGISFSIVGVDGVRYYGSHLSVLLSSVRPGVRVRVGQSIGRVGKSGDARYTTSHLHFGLSWPTGPGIWWVRRGEVYPWPYLDAWRVGSMRSPAAAVAAKHRQVGDGGCTVDC